MLTQSFSGQQVQPPTRLGSSPAVGLCPGPDPVRPGLPTCPCHSVGSPRVPDPLDGACTHQMTTRAGCGTRGPPVAVQGCQHHVRRVQRVDEVGGEAILLFQRVGLSGGGKGSGASNLARPGGSPWPCPPSAQAYPPAQPRTPTGTHWVVSPLWLKVRLWMPPLICRVGEGRVMSPPPTHTHTDTDTARGRCRGAHVPTPWSPDGRAG